MRRRGFNLVWSKSEKSFGSIFYKYREGQRRISRYYPTPDGRERLVQDAKRILRAGFAAGYKLHIIPEQTDQSSMGWVGLVFTK